MTVRDQRFEVQAVRDGDAVVLSVHGVLDAETASRLAEDIAAELSSNPSTLGAFPGGASNALNTPGGGYVAVEMVFIQFAGFTFGKSASAYATPWNGYPGNNNSFMLGGHDTVTGVNNIQYTAQFGNGVSGTIGLDDPVVFNRTSVYNLGYALSAVGVSAAGNAYAGVHAPDVVGNIRVDQAWGLFQISAAAHEVSGSYNFLNAVAVPAGAVGPVREHLERHHRRLYGAVRPCLRRLRHAAHRRVGEPL